MWAAWIMQWKNLEHCWGVGQFKQFYRCSSKGRSLHTHTHTHTQSFTFWKSLWRTAVFPICIAISTLLFHEIGFQAKFRFVFHISKLFNYSMTWVTRGICAISLLLAEHLLCCVCGCQLSERNRLSSPGKVTVCRCCLWVTDVFLSKLLSKKINAGFVFYHKDNFWLACQMLHNTKCGSPDKIKVATCLGNLTFSFQRPQITGNDWRLTPLSQHFFADLMNENTSQ